MFRKLLLTASAAALMLVLQTAANADPLVANLGGANQTGNGSMSGFFTITAVQNGSSTTFTISSAASGPNAPQASSFITQIAFNATGTLTAGTRTVAGGGITGTTVNQGNFDFGGLTVMVGSNAQCLPPQCGFDVLINLPTDSGSRLSAGESITFTVSGLTGVNFDVTGNANFAAFAKIQGLAGNPGSIKVGEVEPIPEPATMILLGTGLAGVAAKMRKRRKQAQG